MNSSMLILASLAVAVTAVIISAIALYLSGKARTWRRYFRSEEQPENLEEIIEKIAGKIRALEARQGESEAEIVEQDRILKTAIQHVGIVRFDSGADEGGNLSFAAAFLDAHQSGIILTSLHGRQHNRIYSKIVKNGASEQVLSDEEKEAVLQALTNKK